MIDIELPGMNGASLVKQICLVNKEVKCIICSMYDDDAFILAALKNGALGYLLKDSTGKQILDALEDLKNGGSPMSPYIARKVIASFQSPLPSPAMAALSEREQEVLRLISEGHTYRVASEKLFISYETVKKHLRNIYQKLHVQNKVEAMNKMRPS
jgi:NarL family two-component system response regulator LiaR